MLNEEKVKLMTRLAMYEQKEGRRALPLSRYYRSDYIGLALIKNLFLISVGYVLLIGCLAVYFLEYLMANIHRMDLLSLFRSVGIGYIATLAVYTVITYMVHTYRYFRAKKSVRDYYRDLTALEKIYIREEKKTAGRKDAGGYRK